jgi:hypothetical protein
MSRHVVKAGVWYFAGVAWDDECGRLKIISTQRQSKAARMHRSAARKLAEALRRDPEIHPRVIRVVPRAALRRAG